MNETKYQVISVVDGIFRHEGFFCGEQQATDMKYWVARRMRMNGEHGEVFVNEIKR